MNSAAVQALRPIKRPGLRAGLLNKILRRYSKQPAERLPEQFEIKDAYLERGAKRTAKLLKRNERVPASVKIEPVTIPTAAGPMAGEWLQDGGADSEHVVLYFHGGGYFMCSAATHRPLTWRLAHAARRRVLAINYRMAPAHRFPAWLEDAVSAYRFLLESGFKPDKVAFGGDSAGGNLVLATLQQLRMEGLPMPGAAFCISPWADLACESESHERNDPRDVMFVSRGVKALARYLVKNEDVKNPLLSPVHADFSGFPPLLIQVSSTEILRDDGRRAAARAQEAGVQVQLEEWHNLPHVFHLFAAQVPESRRAIRHLAAFVRAHT